MNSIVLMAEVLTDPELRRTPDNQSSIASFLVQFAGGRAEDAPYRIKVVGWNNFHKGDQVVVEGRLRLDIVDRGTYKEKRTELVAQRVHSFGAGSTANTTATTTAAPARSPRANPSSAPSAAVPTSSYAPVASPATNAPDYDDIPF
jgi:single-strand DNA-binding protein